MLQTVEFFFQNGKFFLLLELLLNRTFALLDFTLNILLGFLEFARVDFDLNLQFLDTSGLLLELLRHFPFLLV